MRADTVRAAQVPKGSRTNRSGPRPGDAGIRLALPSDGDLYEPTLAFLKSCGMAVDRPSARRYMATINALPGATVLFQRTGDITQKMEEGSAELGITGLDRFLEGRREGSPVVQLIEDLNFGQCDLVIAVPESWLDVVSTDDLADLAVEFRQTGRQLRIATKYPRLLRKFLYSRDINYFSLVQASGSLEAAPEAGYADLIADLTASGVTLRENRLKTLAEGSILASQACLIGNRKLLKESPRALDLARNMLELVEGHLRAGSFYHLTANVRGDSAEAVGARILSRADLAGLEGPTISSVYNVHEEEAWSVSLVVPREQLLEAVDHLRDSGGTDIFASQISYLFKGRSPAYQRLLDRLEDG